jgi:hypothetical protein
MPPPEPICFTESTDGLMRPTIDDDSIIVIDDDWSELTGRLVLLVVEWRRGPGRPAIM